MAKKPSSVAENYEKEIGCEQRTSDLFPKSLKFVKGTCITASIVYKQHSYHVTFTVNSFLEGGKRLSLFNVKFKVIPKVTSMQRF